MLNSDSRSRSAVGLIACDVGAASRRPRKRPPTMRISASCPAGTGGRAPSSPTRKFRLTETLCIALALLARTRRTLALACIQRRRADPSVGGRRRGTPHPSARIALGAGRRGDGAGQRPRPPPAQSCPARSWARRNPHRPKPRSARRADHARSAFSPPRLRLQADRRAGTDRTKPGSGGSPPARDDRARSCTSRFLPSRIAKVSQTLLPCARSTVASIVTIPHAIDGDAASQRIELRLRHAAVGAHAIAPQPSGRRQFERARKPTIVREQ